jgi:glycosyltransferase 2 family protein
VTNDESQSEAPARRKAALMPRLRASVSLTILGGLALKMDWSHVADAFRGMTWGFWLAAVGVYFLSQVLSALRWQWLSRPLGFQRPLRRYVGDTFVGMFFNLLLPTSIGGDAMRAILLNGRSGRKIAALLSVFLDRLSGLLVLLALACVAALACPMPLPPWMTTAVGAAAGMAVVGLLMLPIAIRLLSTWESPRPVVARLRRLAESLRAALGVFRNRPRLILAATALSVLIQLSGVAQVALIGRAIGADVPLSIYGVAVPMVALLTLLPVSLNGMGVREAGMALFLQPAGVNPGRAVTIAFLWFCSQTVAGLAGAGVYLSARSRRPEVSHDDAVGDHSDQGRARQHRAAA